MSGWVNGCKYSIDVPAIDLFPDPLYHGQWQVSQRTRNHPLGAAEAERVDREREGKIGQGRGRREDLTLILEIKERKRQREGDILCTLLGGDREG